MRKPCASVLQAYKLGLCSDSTPASYHSKNTNFGYAQYLYQCELTYVLRYIQIQVMSYWRHEIAQKLNKI